MVATRRAVRGRIAWVYAAAVLGGCASGGTEREWGMRAPAAASVIEVETPLLAARMAALSRRSPTWRAGLDSVRASGFRVVVTEPARARRVSGLEDYRPRYIGEVIPLRNAAGEVTGAVVVVDVVRLRKLTEAAGLSAAVMAGDVDRILIHEVYGHVVPLSQSRRLSGGCPDPRPGQPPESSCAIRRENRIRAELGLERRTSYDIRGLAVGRSLERARNGDLGDGRDER
ncbi:MAG TPA: hypothetical protein VF188_10370 [Longimicrobiales bacterium]